MLLPVPIEFREQMPHDLERLTWTGGETHLSFLSARAERIGEDVVLVGELPTGELVASGVVHLDQDGGLIEMLSVRDDWRGLGVGTGMIAALESRAAGFGADTVRLEVEHDNPRARALYQRLGYRDADGPAVLGGWPLDSGQRYVTLCQVMVKQLVVTQADLPDQDEPDAAAGWGV
jgi:GNAT superfamily N-acetyltransferase